MPRRGACRKQHRPTLQHPKRHQALFGVSLGVFLVFDRVVFEVAGRTERKWNGSVTVTAVILAPISLAKRTACSTALAARSDPSVGIKIFLNMSWCRLGCGWN